MTDETQNTDITLVVAVARNGVIGHQNALPWHIPDDLRRFRRLTMGKPVIMGRKTFDSIGKPLPGRHNIIVTRNPEWHADGVTPVASLDAALRVARAKGAPTGIMVIGGAGIFRQALEIATRIEWTSVDMAPEGDVFMPEVDPAVWKCVARQDVEKDGDVPAHGFLTLVRRV